MKNGTGKPRTPRDNTEHQRTEQASIRRRSRGSSEIEPADWGNIDPALLAGVIRAITRHGFAVQFGYTRDGGSYVLRIVGDGEPFNEYIRATEDANLYLSGVIEDYLT